MVVLITEDGKNTALSTVWVEEYGKRASKSLWHSTSQETARGLGNLFVSLEPAAANAEEYRTVFVQTLEVVGVLVGHDEFRYRSIILETSDKLRAKAIEIIIMEPIGAGGRLIVQADETLTARPDP